MLANIKFKSIEELKLIRAEGYNYNKFLKDSSDDHPKYNKDKKIPFVIKQADDDMNYKEEYNK